MALHMVVDPLRFHRHLGVSNYESMVRFLDWCGPRDIHFALYSERVNLKGATILDVGIGTGQLSDVFRARAAGKIIGIDGVPDFLNACIKNNRADEVHVCDVASERLPLEDGSVDLVTACGLLSYIADPQPLIHDMLRVVRPGGHVVVNFHPVRGGIARELIPASSVQRAGVVTVHHHEDSAIRACFEQAGARHLTARDNTQGILRADGTWAHLHTALFRRNVPGVA